MASILIVEDSATDAFVLQRMLEQNGHSVELAANGKDGIDSAVALQPDVILMDVVMPDMNGFQATRELRRLQQTAEIPVIIVSSKQQKTDRIWGMRQGAVDYLCKPVSAIKLAHSVNSALTSNAIQSALLQCDAE